MVLLLRATDLSKSFKKAGYMVSALQDASIDIRAGECVGVVGESGSGKSTLARLMLALEQPDGGEILVHGTSITNMKGRELRLMRKHIQAVFQDPTSALNGRMPVWRSVMEPILNFPDAAPAFLRPGSGPARIQAAKLFEMVGLSVKQLDAYPHELSGGQRQRVAIARGIALQPDLLICDEPTSSLDVIGSDQIMQLLRQLQREIGMAILFISHDIAAVASICSRMIVMKEGRIVDRVDRDQIDNEHVHPYTRLLISKARAKSEDLPRIMNTFR